MIDELVKAADAMRNADISAKDWHPKLKTLPKVTAKAPCIRIWLTGDGHIHDLELISSELAVQLRKYEPDLGRSLPGFNVRPLYRLVKTDDDIKKASKGKAGEKLKAEWTKEFLNTSADERANDDFWEKTRDGLRRCFGRVREDLEKYCNGRLREEETIHKFFEIARKMDVEQFQEEYSIKLQDKIVGGTLPVVLMCYFVTAEKKQKEDSDSREPVPKFSVFLDIKDYKKYPVAHPKTIERLNILLSGGETGQVSNFGDGDTDAYGMDTAALNEKFPEVTLPLLGGVKLRSQVKVVPAQSRYGFCEAQTFHVGAESRKRTKRALEWLKAPERDGETYGIAGDKELLFAYPSVLPNKKISLTKMFGAQQDDSYQKEDSFKRLAASVIEQLKGLGTENAKAELEIFSLRKMDKARTKVVYYRNVTVASLEQASTAWHRGCQNIPLLAVRDKNEKTGKSYPVEEQTVFPVKLYRYLNATWKHNGQRADTGKSKVKIFTPTDGLRLLLDRPNNALAAHMLSHFMQHAQGYFLTLCRGTGKNESTSLPDKEYYPGILGLLLFNLGNKKEDFMKESAFLLGRCLRIADEIHRLYCEVERKKKDGKPDIPPELCGSSLLVGMTEFPTMALDQLRIRSMPYIKWAQGGRDKEDKGGLVHYWMKHWSAIADQLHVLEWPKRLTPEERAQVFLGYLASFPKSEKSTTTDQTGSDNTTEQGEKNE
ncbi:MAG: hypothetical protein FWD79_10740 [Desulfobulbus sp.]|nr:hypothetical protein [Desulfobulbus sp.]